MNEDLDSMATRLNEVRDSIKVATGRPRITFRDTLSLMRENIAGKMYSQTHARMNNQTSQPAQELTSQGNPQASVSLSRGLPLLKKLRGRFGGQQAPRELSPEEAQIEIEQDYELQRAAEKQRRLNKLLRRKSFSVDGV